MVYGDFPIIWLTFFTYAKFVPELTFRIVYLLIYLYKAYQSYTMYSSCELQFLVYKWLIEKLRYIEIYIETGQMQ